VRVSFVQGGGVFYKRCKFVYGLCSGSATTGKFEFYVEDSFDS